MPPVLSSSAALLDSHFEHPASRGHQSIFNPVGQNIMQRTKQHAHDSRPRGVFITATDTGVGKTIVASALVQCLTQRGIDVGVMKPIETGVSRSAKAQSDGARLRRAAGSHDPMTEVCPYVFRLPVAPFSAAYAEGRTVKIATIMRVFHALRRKHALMVVEGIGGVYTPITQRVNILNLIYHMKLSAIVVGQSGLGGINHALLTIHALRLQKIPIVSLILNQRWPVQTKSSHAQEQSTISLLRRFSGVPVVGPLLYNPVMNLNWNDGLVRLVETAPITKLARLLTRTIHDGSSRTGADARRDGHAEA
jgi:dethiobiotin synthetase